MQTKIFITLCLLFALVAAVPLLSQDAVRWMRFPDRGSPVLQRHQLQNADAGGQVFQVKFEKKPVRPLLRTLRRSFPELWPAKQIIDDTIDTSESTILQEKLQNEADEFLQLASDSFEVDTASAPPSLF